MAIVPDYAWGSSICNGYILVSVFSLMSAGPYAYFAVCRFGWTGFTPAIHWAVPTAAGIFIGFGVLCVFLPCFNYLVDSYISL